MAEKKAAAAKPTYQSFNASLKTRAQQMYSTFGHTPGDIARFFNCDPDKVFEYLKGKKPTPQPVEAPVSGDE